MPRTLPTKSSRWSLPRIFWLLAVLLMLAPAIAMRVTDQVNWQANDFIAFGVMLVIPGLALELANRRHGPSAYRTGVALGLAAAFLLVWVNGAVGLIGSEDNPANLMYGGVLGVVLVGALSGRLRARGMARTMIAAAVAQVVVLFIALALDSGHGAPSWPVGTITGTAFFVLLWVAGAWSFHNAARAETEASGIGNRV